MGIGGFVINSVMDGVGRRRMIPVSLMLIFASNFAGGFAHSGQMLKFYVFALGCGCVNPNIIFCLTDYL